jgi:CHASE2 domain-containing sensor protein
VLDGLSRWARLETLTVRLAEMGGPEGVHADVAVVAIDSLDVLEEEPWGTAWRPRVAGLLDRLSGAGTSVVALDISFAVTTPHDDELAAALRRAEERGTRVIVGVDSLGADHQPAIAPALRFADWGTLCAATGAQQVLDLVVRKAGNGGPSTQLPSLPLRAVAAHLGLEIAALEPAGRRVLLLDEQNRPTPVRLAAVQRIRRAAPGCPVLTTGDSVASLVVDYSRRGALRDTRRRMSYGTVMAAGASLSRLTDKLVVVGVETGDVVVSLYPGMG